MFRSTMILPEQHLALIHAYQRELRPEAERLATGRFTAATNHKEGTFVNALIMSARRARLLAVAGLLVAALAVTALAPARPASADTPQPIVLPPLRPDLRVTSAGVTYLNGPFFPAGYYLVFVVANTGPFGSAGPFNVSAAAFAENGTSFQTFAVASMEHGGSRTFWRKLPSPDTCEYDQLAAKIVVDTGNSVHETDEANNTAVAHFLYGTGPC